MNFVGKAVLFLGIALIVAGITGFFYTLLTKSDWTIYPVIVAFVTIGAIMLREMAHPPVSLIDPQPTER